MTFDPDELGALYDRARRAEDRGDIARAAELFRACLAMDPDDHCGVVLRLAGHGLAAPDRAPPAYVATLFDQHAEAFDDILVEALGYHVPTHARRLAGALLPPRARVLDLGCGTGLAGAAFADVAGEVVGVDLAEQMLPLADARGVYADLYVGEAVDFLREWDGAPFDAILATDVLPYLGDLAPFAGAAARCLAPGGLVVASTERGEAGWRVTPTQRFAHALSYIADTFAGAGFAPAAQEPVIVRHEAGEPVPGDIVVLRLRPFR